MRSSRFVALAFVGALGITAISCSDGTTSTRTESSSSESSTSMNDAPATTAVKADVTAADLRSKLTVVLNEHVILAADATNAALGGRQAEFDAAVAELDRNSQDLSEMVAAAYGDSAGEAFLPLWRKHIGFFVDYTTAVGANDQAAADKAVADLTAYADEFAAFLNSANPSLPTASVADLVKTHILTLKGVVDAQASGDPQAAYTALGQAVGHMHMIADPLAAAISQQFPEKFPGDSASAAATLQTTLNSALMQHVAYAASATNAALGGRMAEFEAAAALLDTNSVAITDAIGSVYGDAAGEAFLPLWRKHIGFFVDYTTALGAGDQAAKDKAAADLTAYADEFAAFLSSANPNLPKEAVSGLVAEHIETLLSVIDAQGSGDQGAAYTALGRAMGHMHMIADPLSAAIVTQFPEQFPAQ
jgi:hypothetical protein